MKKTTLFAAALFALPFVASAQNLTPVKNLVVAVGQLVGMLIPILVTVALVVFMWGLIKYIRSSGEGHKEGRDIMIAGLVSLFVMVSVWGIIYLAQSALSIPNVGSQSPSFPAPGGSSGTGTSGGTVYPMP